MMEFAGKTSVRIIAHSPGEHTILIVETPDGSVFATHRETGYDLARGKSVEREWVRENAVGRHSFVAVEPPEETEASELSDYAAKLNG